MAACPGIGISTGTWRAINRSAFLHLNLSANEAFLLHGACCMLHCLTFTSTLLLIVISGFEGGCMCQMALGLARCNSVQACSSTLPEAAPSVQGFRMQASHVPPLLQQAFTAAIAIMCTHGIIAGVPSAVEAGV